MLQLGNLNKYFTDADFIRHCEVLARQYKANERSFAEILRHTTYGEAVEKICSDVLKLEQTDFSISAYDATKNNLKIEIKHTVKNSKWWSFKHVSYEYFLKNSANLDYIFLCYVDDSNNCYLKYIANAKTFRDYIRESNFKDYYYNVDKAVQYRQCYEINNMCEIPHDLN